MTKMSKQMTSESKGLQPTALGAMRKELTKLANVYITREQVSVTNKMLPVSLSGMAPIQSAFNSSGDTSGDPASAGTSAGAGTGGKKAPTKGQTAGNKFGPSSDSPVASPTPQGKVSSNKQAGNA